VRVLEALLAGLVAQVALGQCPPLGLVELRIVGGQPALGLGLQLVVLLAPASGLLLEVLLTRRLVFGLRPQPTCPRVWLVVYQPRMCV